MRRRAGGPPNGKCKNCSREAASLHADYCSQRCRYEDEEQQARAEYYAKKYEEHQS